MVIRGLLGLILLFSMPIMAVTQLTARLDKNPVMLGESVLLEVSADSRVAGTSINFRVLEDNFTVMVPSVNQSSRIINGDASHNTTWNVTLLPKASGTFRIPAFSVEGVSSSSILLEVVPAQQGSGAVRDVFLESKLSTDNIIVQQMVYYDVTIYFSGDIQNGGLSEPLLDDATIQRVGQDQEGSELIDGERYRSITRRYAITPQRSGTFTITPPTFSGDVIDRNSARQNFYARSRTVVREAEPVSITVQAQPNDFSGSWLVAGLVTLHEEWQPEQTELIQGEPITRIITLSAVDVAANQLPDISSTLPEGFRVYQEQPQIKGAERARRLVAQKVITSAIIANTPGEFELPEVNVPWWNSQTNRQEMAVLPARTVQVKAVPGRSPSPLVSTDVTSPVITTAAANPVSVSAWHWSNTSTLLLAGWLLTIGLLIWQRRPASRPKAHPNNTPVRFDSNALRTACRQHNKAKARQQLLLWARHHNLLQDGSLSTLSQRVGPGALQEQIDQLNAALYSDSAVSWQGNQLLQAWSDFQLSTPPGARGDALPPLYPH
tara:strand:+ start:180 stop:1829 length:1650 start_codon:yes stop_codon:yes gene_type:complete